MVGNIGPGMLVILIVAALLVFGPRRLPELGRAIGRTLSEFKKGTKEIMNDSNEAEQGEVKKDDDRLPE